MPEIEDNYRRFQQEYQAIFQPIFEEALESSEFNFILSLLAVRGIQDAGWDPFDNTIEIAELVHQHQEDFEDILRVNMNLWAYVNLIECAEHFELIANLLRTIKGEDYIVAVHRDRNYMNMNVTAKIDRLRSIARDTDYQDAARPFELTFNNRFRNAIGHGDYALKGGDDGGITIADDSGFPTIFSHQETSDLVNRALALHATIKGLRAHFIESYQHTKVISSSIGFGRGETTDVTVIVRQGKGLLGVRCIGGYDFLEPGQPGVPFESRLSRCTAEELELIKSGVNELPEEI